MESGEFTLVHLPSNGKGRRNILKNSVFILNKKDQLSTSQVANEYIDISFNLSLIEQNLAKTRLLFSQEYIDNTLSCIQNLLCDCPLVVMKIIGLGSFENSLSSSFQLILAEAICNYFSIRKVYCQDPITNNLEKLYLKRHNIDFIEGTNLFVLNKVDGFSLYYMIHSEHFMYEHILASNFVNNQFKNLIIIGNNFRNYRDGFDEYLYIKKFASICRIMELDIPVDSYAFSDTCINYICDYNSL